MSAQRVVELLTELRDALKADGWVRAENAQRWLESRLGRDDAKSLFMCIMLLDNAFRRRETPYEGPELEPAFAEAIAQAEQFARSDS